MARVLMVILWICVVVYAIADWWRTPDDAMPGRLNKHLWLLIILITIPTMAIGAIAWIVMRLVLQAEARQRGETPDASIIDEARQRFARREAAPPEPSAPDDDPAFLEKLQRDIARQKANERDAAQREEQQRRAAEKHATSADADSDTTPGEAPTSASDEEPDKD